MRSMLEHAEHAAEFAAADATYQWAESVRAAAPPADGQSILDLVLDPVTTETPMTADGRPDWDAILNGIDVAAVDLDAITVRTVRDLMGKLRSVLASREHQGQHRQVGGLFNKPWADYQPGEEIGRASERRREREARWNADARTRTATTRCSICGVIGCDYGPQVPANF